ncbi:MAG: hypothetical protein IKO47_09015 [Ruminococcus sp.]|nr:hypothetical protein [Ruminococcus sp.]
MPLITETKDFVCSVCGASSEHTIITETDPPKDAPDLDLRPAEPHRSYMRYWVMQCPGCGYCNAMLDMPADIDRDYLSSEEYLSFGGISGVSGKPAEMIKKALICLKGHDYREALQTYVYAAWLLDDEKLDEQAAACRKAAVRIYDEHPVTFRKDPNFSVLIADLLRRSGEFSRVVRDYEGQAYPSRVMTSIAFFEVNLAAKGDRDAHRADEVPGITAI